MRRVSKKCLNQTTRNINNITIEMLINSETHLPLSNGFNILLIKKSQIESIETFFQDVTNIDGNNHSKYSIKESQIYRTYKMSLEIQIQLFNLKMKNNI